MKRKGLIEKNFEEETVRQIEKLKERVEYLERKLKKKLKEKQSCTYIYHYPPTVWESYYPHYPTSVYNVYGDTS